MLAKMSAHFELARLVWVLFYVTVCVVEEGCFVECQLVGGSLSKVANEDSCSFKIGEAQETHGYYDYKLGRLDGEEWDAPSHRSYSLRQHFDVAKPRSTQIVPVTHHTSSQDLT
uniref:Uncharacterized protein n=1 Tax=Timema genevievae TaxID=629358 RepID=A0A7R9JPE6_TIMGE|nr:unnamed protein product [Timema genevievae]